MIPNRIAAVFVALVLALATPVGLVGAAGAPIATTNATEVDTNHQLTDAGAINEYRETGSVTGDMPALQMQMTFAEERGDVGIGNRLTPTNIRNNFLRITYKEDVERTVRLFIPREYAVPYTRDEVNAIGSAHVASYQPARNAEYLQVTIHVDGPTEIVLPVQKDDSLSASLMEGADERLERTTGVSLIGEPGSWTYVNESNLTSDAGMELPVDDGDNVVVQYDGTPDAQSETWLNAPEGESSRSDVYWYQRDSGNGSVYVVSKTDDPPAVRYRTDGGTGDMISGWINDATEVIPDKLFDNPLSGLFGGD
jgi:hypothetical protein